MTSNLEHVIDDAIESRFAAKIIYPRPDADAARAIWTIQIQNHGWTDPKYSDLIDIMVKENPNFSGRSIRNLMKLATLLAKYRKTELSLDILRHASKFSVHDGRNAETTT